MAKQLRALRALNEMFINSVIDLHSYEVEVSHLAHGLSLSNRIRLSNEAFVTL